MYTPQKWPDCCPELKNYVNGLTELFRMRLGRLLLGFYLHGSLAMGCWYFPKSDLDFLAVVSRPIPADILKTLGIQVAKYAENCPGKGGVELSVVTKEALKSPDLQVPFELHYSPMWHTQVLEGNVDFCKPKRDPDLPAHFAVVRQRGACLYGQAAKELFGPVDWARFRESVLVDIRDLFAGEALLDKPCYGVLNCCRALQLISSPAPECFSKEEGALWALKHLPAPFLPLIRQALGEYRGASPAGDPAAGGWDRDLLVCFCSYVRAQIPELSE